MFTVCPNVVYQIDCLTITRFWVGSTWAPCVFAQAFRYKTALICLLLASFTVYILLFQKQRKRALPSAQLPTAAAIQVQAVTKTATDRPGRAHSEAGSWRASTSRCNTRIRTDIEKRVFGKTPFIPFP